MDFFRGESLIKCYALYIYASCSLSIHKEDDLLHQEALSIDVDHPQQLICSLIAHLQYVAALNRAAHTFGSNISDSG